MMARQNRTIAERTSWQPRGSRNRHPWMRAVGLLVALLALAGAAGYLLIFSPLLWIKTIEVTGAKTISQSDVSDLIDRASESHFGPLRSQSTLLINKADLTRQVKDAYRDAAKVEVTTHWPSKLTVALTERQSTLLWQSRENYYLVDRQGIAFQKSDKRTDLVAVEDSTGLPVEVGKQVVGSKFIRVLEDIQRGMTAAGIKVVSFRIPESTFEVQAITDQGYFALFDASRSIDFQVDALKRAVPQGKPHEYADLRVPGRVYIK